MSADSWLVTLAIGALVGFLTGLFLRGSGYGILGNVIVGLLGALIGQWLFRALGVSLALGKCAARARDHRADRGLPADASRQPAAPAELPRARHGLLAPRPELIAQRAGTTPAVTAAP